MASTIAGAPATPEGKPSNSISRIFGALFSPKETFASIAQRPTWLAPVLLSCVVSLGLVSVFSTRVGWDRMIAKQNETNPLAARRMDQMTPEQRQQMVATQVKLAKPLGYVGSLAGPFIFTALFAAILLGLFNLAYGAQVGFKTSMGIVSYAFVPRLIYALIGILVIFLKDPDDVNLQNLIASNPGALMGSESAKWLVALAGQMDIFSFWVMILLALGYSAANPKKVSFGGALAGIVGLWLVYVIFQVAIAAAFS